MLLTMLERAVDATREWGVEAVLIGAVLVKLAAPVMDDAREHTHVHDQRMYRVTVGHVVAPRVVQVVQVENLERAEQALRAAEHARHARALARAHARTWTVTATR
jgi:hypothetical protein